MEYTTEEKRKADLEIKELIASGKYIQQDMRIIDNIYDVELTNETKRLLSNVLFSYLEYLESLKKVDVESLEEYLKLCKNADILDNQKLEKEDSLLIAIYMHVQTEFAIDEILKYQDLDTSKILTVHEMLMKNTSSAKSIGKGFRDNNRKYVGTIVNGSRIIQYFPIDYIYIEETMNKILDYYNNPANEKTLDDIFIKSIIIHGLVASYQMFDDGNTRLARLLQHVKMFKLTNQLTDHKLILPSLYATRTYYPHRTEYRNLIKELVINTGTESWNNWISFNLKRIEDKLFYATDKVSDIKKLMKESKSRNIFN